jgi:hypothetical protein
MQQNYDMAEKVKVYIDGEEIAGLVNFGEIDLAVNQIQVPEFDIIRNIDSGVKTIPAVEMIYKVSRGSKTLKFFQDWFNKKETHDVSKVSTDADGVEFSRDLLPASRCVGFKRPAYDAASPTYAQVTVTIAPWDIFPVS